MIRRDAHLDLAHYGLDELINHLTDEWREQANCRDADPDLFFPGVGASIPQLRQTIATYCDPCPVIDDCREAGREETAGIWGGKTPGDRRDNRLARRPYNWVQCEICGIRIKSYGSYQGQTRRYCSKRCNSVAYRDRQKAQR